MKKVFKLLSLGLLSLTCFSFASCSYTPNNNTGDDQGQTDDEEDDGQNEIEDVTPTYNSISEATEAVTNSLTDDQKSHALPISRQENVYSIVSSGAYYYSGTLASMITINKNAGNVHIYLDGVSLSVSATNAITIKKGAYVTISILGTNNLSNSGDAKHVIDSKENLVINGTGILNINSTKSGIVSDKTFIGLGGTINLTTLKHGISADSIYVDGLTINADNVASDILHAESDYDEVTSAPEYSFGAGFVYIKTGTINTTYVYGDAIQADSYVSIKGGTFNLTTTPTWNNNYVATTNKEKGMFNKSTHQKVGADDVRAGSTYAVLEESVKAIKVGVIDYYLSSDTNQQNKLTVSSTNYTISIDGGTFNINTVDDAIHTNSGSVIIGGGNLTINTSDDGIHADTNLKILGDSIINIQNSYEGIEAETVDISGGSTTVIAQDDGINATNSALTENQQKTVCQINISGGRLDVTVNPNGDRDGVDSNGGIKITGGVIIARGPNSQMAAPMDAANIVSITGGTTIIIGCAPGSGGQFSGPGGRPGGGGGEGTFSSTLTKTQSSSKGLSSGSHTVTVNGTTITYSNSYSYSGYTTVYASGTATIN